MPLDMQKHDADGDILTKKIGHNTGLAQRKIIATVWAFGCIVDVMR